MDVTFTQASEGLKDVFSLMEHYPLAFASAIFIFQLAVDNAGWHVHNRSLPDALRPTKRHRKTRQTDL